MRQKVKGIMAHLLFSGSAIMVFGSNFANFFAYLYHVVIGRLLGPSLYGELAATLSLIGMISASFSFFSLVIVKFVSSAEEDEINGLLSWFMKMALIAGIGVGGIIVVATPFISSFFNIKNSLVVLTGPIFFFSIITLIYRSFLQGLLKFVPVTVLTIIEMVGRFVFGLLFILLGLSVFGALFGILVSIVLAVWITKYYYLNDYKIKASSVKFNKAGKVVSYAIPIFLTSVASNSIYSTDVLLVKRFFDPSSAGIYASLSTLGKIIFFGTSPVMAVMFPMISKKHSRGESYNKILILSLLMTIGISLMILTIYAIFPELMINMLFGGKYLSAAPYLVWFGLFITIFTIDSLFVNFYLSREKTKVVYFVVATMIMQAVGIWFYHSSILEVIRISIASVLFLLISLVLYFAYDTKKR